MRKAKLFTFVLFVLFFCFDLSAQSKLSSQVNMPPFQDVTIREVFEVLYQKESVLFSYNARLLNPDSVVRIDRYKGLLIDYLEQMLGEAYMFKETPSHIIITYSPKRLQVHTNEINHEHDDRAVITGYVKDLRSELPIAKASVIDNYSYQTATLTDKNGYFSLLIKKPGQQVNLLVNKVDYRDTSLVILLPIDVYSHVQGKKIGYYLSGDTTRDVYSSFLGSWFTTSAQRIQSLNLGGLFVYSPFQLSLTPGVSTHGFFNSQVVNNFSINLLGGYTAGVDGFEAAGIFNINQYNVKGMQMAGVFNVVGGDMRGFQSAGVANMVNKNISGVQVAGVWNKVDSVNKGVQISGVVNMANQVKGIQFAGVANLSKQDVGHQIGGVVNIAKKVRGIQFAGVLNIADSSDYPVGVFNWIKNGSRQLSLEGDAAGFLGVQFRSGGRVTYSLLGIGRYLDDSMLGYGADFGLGARVFHRSGFSVSAELVSRIQFDRDFKYMDAQKVAFRLVPTMTLARKFNFYLAPSIVYSEALVHSEGSRKINWNIGKADPSQNTIHGGLVGGIGYVF